MVIRPGNIYNQSFFIYKNPDLGIDDSLKTTPPHPNAFSRGAFFIMGGKGQAEGCGEFCQHPQADVSAAPGRELQFLCTVPAIVLCTLSAQTSSRQLPAHKGLFPLFMDEETKAQDTDANHPAVSYEGTLISFMGSAVQSRYCPLWARSHLAWYTAFKNTPS